MPIHPKMWKIGGYTSGKPNQIASWDTFLKFGQPTRKIAPSRVPVSCPHLWTSLNAFNTPFTPFGIFKGQNWLCRRSQILGTKEMANWWVLLFRNYNNYNTVGFWTFQSCTDRAVGIMFCARIDGKASAHFSKLLNQWEKISKNGINDRNSKRIFQLIGSNSPTRKAISEALITRTFHFLHFVKWTRYFYLTQIFLYVFDCRNVVSQKRRLSVVPWGPASTAFF